MKIYCSCCDKVQPVRIDNCRDAKTNEPFQDIVCATCDLVIASGTDIAPPEFVTHTVEQPDDWSEWVCPAPTGYLMKCCDCGLVHEMDFRVAKYQPQPSEEFEIVNDPDLQAQFRAKRRDDWTPKDTAYRPGGLAQPEHDHLAGVPPMLPQMRDGETIVVTEYAQPEQEKPACISCGSAPTRYVYEGTDFPGTYCDNCGPGSLSAQPEQEPVAWFEHNPDLDAWFLAYSKNQNPGIKSRPLVFGDTAPPQRKPLSDEQLKEIWLNGKDHGDDWLDVQGIARAIEAAHGIKGEA